MMNQKAKKLVLGMGNDILSDDGIGLMLVRDLANRINDQDVKFEISCCGGLEIMELIKGFKTVVFVDAIRTRNGSPGEVYYFRPSDFRETSHLSNLHDINFLTSIKLGTALDLDLPDDLHIIATEIIEDMEFSDELTPPLKEKYPEILEKVLDIVNGIILT